MLIWTKILQTRVLVVACEVVLQDLPVFQAFEKWEDGNVMIVEDEFHVRTGQVMTDATFTCVEVLDMSLQSNHSVSRVSVNRLFYSVFSLDFWLLLENTILKIVSPLFLFCRISGKNVSCEVNEMNKERVCGFPVLGDQKTYNFLLGVSNPIGQTEASLLVDISQRGKSYKGKEIWLLHARHLFIWGLKEIWHSILVIILLCCHKYFASLGNVNLK